MHPIGSILDQFYFYISGCPAASNVPSLFQYPIKDVRNHRPRQWNIQVASASWLHRCSSLSVGRKMLMWLDLKSFNLLLKLPIANMTFIASSYKRCYIVWDEDEEGRKELHDVGSRITITCNKLITKSLSQVRISFFALMVCLNLKLGIMIHVQFETDQWPSTPLGGTQNSTIDSHNWWYK